jgi:hypothetical protein
MTLELNEITVLMAINTVGILAIIGLFIYLAIDAVRRGNADTDGPEHFNRN